MLIQLQGFTSLRQKAFYGLSGLQADGVSRLHITGVEGGFSGWLQLTIQGDSCVDKQLKAIPDEQLPTVCALIDMYCAPKIPYTEEDLWDN